MNSNYWRQSLLEVIKQNIARCCQQTFVFKSLLTTPSNVLHLDLKQIFLPIIWIFTENKCDGIESRLTFKNIFYFMRKWESNSKLIKTLSVPSFDMAFQERIWPLKSLASCDWCSILIIIIECAAQVEIGCTRYV